jgi:hypothetical protein
MRSRYKSLICPHCDKPIERRDLRSWVCPHCHADIGAANSYFRLAELLTFAWIVLVGIITHKSSSGGTWLLGSILSGALFWFVFIVLVSPWLSKGHTQPRITFAVMYLSAVTSMFVVEFLGFGAMILLLGNASDVRDHLEMLSMPLVWISGNFLITKDKDFSDVCGILLGNSFFLGLLGFACYQPIRWVFRRNRLTQLSITDRPSIDDDDA